MVHAKASRRRFLLVCAGVNSLYGFPCLDGCATLTHGMTLNTACKEPSGVFSIYVINGLRSYRVHTTFYFLLGRVTSDRIHGERVQEVWLAMLLEVCMRQWRPC